MVRRTSTIDLAKTLPLPTLRKIGRGDGEIVNPLDLSLTWKVKAAETGFAFSIYEMTIAPGAKIPLHVHPYAEFFYVLEGQIEAMGIDEDGRLTWTPISAGESANAPAMAPHGLMNRSTQSTTFLSTSTFEHEKSFNDYQQFLDSKQEQSVSEVEKAAVLMDIFAKQKVTFLDVSRASID